MESSGVDGKKPNTGQSYFMAVDGRHDFVIYNADNYQMNNEQLKDDDLVELEIDNKIIDKLKSDVWSCSSRWFFVMQDEGIYLFNVYSKTVWLCKKHTTQFFELYLNTK